MFTLRDYQQKAINDIERHKKNLIYLATGSGKSVIFKQLALNAIANNEKVLFIVKRQQVLSQAVNKHFLSIHNSVSMMMGSNKFRFADILCCSMDTLYRRKHLYSKILNEYQTVIIDESHDCTADNYQSIFKYFSNQTVIGLTATPFLIGKKTHHFWDKVIHPVTTMDLIRQGHLVWPEVWISQNSMTTKNVKTTAGDYNQKQLFDANDSSVVYGSIVDEYIKHGKNKRCFCFCINVEHSKKVALEYNSKGIGAVHVDADTPLLEREQILRDFAEGKIKVITNINVFATGTDVPEAEIGQMARPTKSKVLWIQQVGRILRPCPEIGKKNAIILDHTDNTMMLGHPAVNDFQAETSLEIAKQNDEQKIAVYQCKSCYYIFSEKTDQCPMCGSKNEVKLRKIKEQKDAELKEIEIETKKQQIDEYEIFKKKYIIDYQGQNINALGLKNKINTIYQKAKHWKHKKNSIFFKAWDLTGNKDDLNLVIRFPKWFTDIKKNESLSSSPESNSKNPSDTSEGIS